MQYIYWVGVLGSSFTVWQKWGGFQENCPANKTTNGSEWRSHNRRQLGSVWITSDHQGTKIQDHGKRTFQSVIKGTKVQNQGTVHYTKWSRGNQKYRIGESLHDRRGQKYSYIQIYKGGGSQDQRWEIENQPKKQGHGITKKRPEESFSVKCIGCFVINTLCKMKEKQIGNKSCAVMIEVSIHIQFSLKL